MNLSSNMYRSSSSCELIREIVKSVLLPDSGSIKEGSSRFTLENVHLKLSSVKREDGQMERQTRDCSEENSGDSKEEVEQFIKELFESLGLIDHNEKQNKSLKEITDCARNRFSQLKGNDYLTKLSSMLQSVEKEHERKIIDQNQQKLV